jgi:hypothetical protein
VAFYSKFAASCDFYLADLQCLVMFIRLALDCAKFLQPPFNDKKREKGKNQKKYKKEMGEKE